MGSKAVLFILITFSCQIWAANDQTVANGLQQLASFYVNDPHGRVLIDEALPEDHFETANESLEFFHEHPKALGKVRQILRTALLLKLPSENSAEILYRLVMRARWSEPQLCKDVLLMLKDWKVGLSPFASWRLFLAPFFDDQVIFQVLHFLGHPDFANPFVNIALNDLADELQNNQREYSHMDLRELKTFLKDATASPFYDVSQLEMQTQIVLDYIALRETKAHQTVCEVDLLEKLFPQKEKEN